MGSYASFAPSLLTEPRAQGLVPAASPQRYLITTSPFMPASLWPMTGQYIS